MESALNVYLIGYRGCGKSTVAPLIGELLGLKFVDLDDWIEMMSEMTIAEIFSQFGEVEFRHRETDAIAVMAANFEGVVSLGGGAPIADGNRELIANSGKTVWLKADSETLWRRISADETTAQRRPDLTSVGGRAEVEQLLASRCHAYESCADYTIEVDTLTPEEIAQRIVKWWKTAEVIR